MAFIIPHKSDLIVDGQIIRQQLIENFKAIEQEESQLRNDLNDETDARKSADSNEQEARKAADKKLDGRIDDANNRMDQLDQEKATHDDVNDLRKEMYQIRDDWHDRASHIARGTDVETTKAVVEQILQEKGLI